MKTLTEFFGPNLVRALQTRQECLAAGKTAEELPAALGESLKVEGEKLQRLCVALELIEKKHDRLKRVIVLQPAEGQKAPSGAVERDGLVYVIEFFAAPAGSAPEKKADPRDDKRRGGKRGDRRGGGEGRGGEGRGRRNEGGRGRPEGSPGVAGEAQTVAGGPAGGSGRRPRRTAPKGPRPEVQQTGEPLKAPAPRPASPKPASPANSESAT